MNLDSVKTRFGIVGHTHRLINAIEIAMQIAPTEVTALIVGENGTGKDVFSKIIHQFSKRKHEPFMAINCGAIPEGTIDSELFGHEKGSFTSAYDSRKGYFEEVNGGTIFLDEIAEMPLSTQSRLLRVLESGEYLRVGSSKIRKTDVRIIAATNTNLIEQIRKGRFREDLYFRLNTVSIKIPPLRDRGEDIALLFRYFASEFSEKYNRMPFELTQEAAEMISRYRWPGNVRELRNFAEKLAVLVEGNTINKEVIAEHLVISDSYLPTVVTQKKNGHTYAEPGREIEMLYKLIFELRQEVSDMKNVLYMGMRGSDSESQSEVYVDANRERTPTDFKNQGSGNYAQTFDEPVEDAVLLEESLSLEDREKELIAKALTKHKNKRRKAAQELGISERTLYRKIKHYGLE